MLFSPLTNIFLYFLLCNQVHSRLNLFIKNTTSLNCTMNNVFDKFYADYEKTYLRTQDPRQITVVGESTENLIAAEPLLKNYPFITCTDVKEFKDSKSFSSGSSLIFYLQDLEATELKKYVKIIRQCRNCNVLFVSGCRVTTHAVDIQFVSTLALRHNLPYVKLAQFENDVIRLYTGHLATNRITPDVRLLDVWKPGIGFDGTDVLPYGLRNLNGRPVSVSTVNFFPKLVLKESKNGSLTIVSGREGSLLLELAKFLNFTLALKYPSETDRIKYSPKTAIVKDVDSGNAEIGIGQLRPTADLFRLVEISVPYDDDCVTWGVPRVVKSSTDILFVEFSWDVWILVGLEFVVTCVLSYVNRNTKLFRNGNRRYPGLVASILEVFSVHLGNPATRPPYATLGKVMLIIHLSYALVMTTAYKTSLASILATDKDEPSIVDVQGIIEANLTVGGSLYDYQILKDQADESELTAQLVNRFIVNNNVTENRNRLIVNQDFAFLGRRSAFKYWRQLFVKTNDLVNFHIFDSCVLYHPTVIVFRDGRFLREAVNNLIQRLFESGIMHHWDTDETNTDKILRRKSAEKYSDNFGSNKFRNILIFYCCCVAVCLLTFCIELLVKICDARTEFFKLCTCVTKCVHFGN